MGAFDKLMSFVPQIAEKFGVGNNTNAAPKYTYDQNTQMYTQMAKGGKVSSASSRADGIAQRGKTRGTMVMCGGGYAKGKK